MKPHIHADSSVKKYGGKREDYIEIHNFLDSSKAHFADHRHRAILHNTFGCFIVERVFGLTLINSDGKEVSTRDIAELHIIEDLGTIPSIQDYLKHMQIQDWMGAKTHDKPKLSVPNQVIAFGDPSGCFPNPNIFYDMVDINSKPTITEIIPPDPKIYITD